MRLSEQAIKEFQAIYYRKFRQKLSDSEARDKAQRFLALMDAIYRPIPSKVMSNNKSVKQKTEMLLTTSEKRIK